jgi:hypothetical protein
MGSGLHGMSCEDMLEVGVGRTLSEHWRERGFMWACHSTSFTYSHPFAWIPDELLGHRPILVPLVIDNQRRKDRAPCAGCTLSVERRALSMAPFFGMYDMQAQISCSGHMQRGCDAACLATQPYLRVVVHVLSAARVDVRLGAHDGVLSEDR